MTELNDPAYRKFVQNIIDNIKKNGFPEKKVAFDLEKMYEAATKKEINFNKVLTTLDEIQIAHEKTPEKVIFFPKDQAPVEAPVSEMPPGADPSMFENVDPSMFGNVDPSMFANMDMSMFSGMDMSALKGMSLPQMMGAVGKMMKNMSPEQMSSLKGMYDNMTDEQKKNLMDKAKDFSPFNKDKNKD